MPEEVYSLLVRPMSCTKEIMRLGWCYARDLWD